MPTELTDDLARLSGWVSVEEAEGLLAWLQTRPQARLDLALCEHLHAAVLQILLHARPAIVAWPADPALQSWLEPTSHP